MKLRPGTQPARLAVIALAFLAVAGPVEAALEKVVLFGPSEFRRDTIAPQGEIKVFSLARAAQSYVIEVRNGSIEQTDLVSSALIALNGATVLKQSDFSQNTSYVEKPVSLGPENHLDVKIGSIPSSHLTITIAGWYAPGDVDHDGDGYTQDEGDCSDGNPAVHPSAAEACDGVDNNCNSIVDEGCLASVTVSPASIPFSRSGEMSQLEVTGQYVGGATADLTASSSGTSYISENTAVATVDSNGLVTAAGEGIASVIATNSRFSAGASVRVVLDGDTDGVPDAADLCPGTPAGRTVDANGCADSQRDSDGDGVTDDNDQCPDTPAGVPANAVGCQESSVQPLPEGSFGKAYEDLVPSDATIESYSPKRFSIVTGLAQDRGGQAIEGVRVTAHNHPEYGSSSTDAQGRFSLPIDGGTTFTMVYDKQGLLTGHRQIYVPWNDIAVAETVKLIPTDATATRVTLDGNPATTVTHRSTAITDEFGTRAATVVFAGDNRAWGKQANGPEIELASITVRATEFDTPDSMPAKLPPTSAYTYCAELSVDEAREVRFEKPLTMYVENFLGFDVGSVVPVGFYDRDEAQWVPAPNGAVVRLLDTNGDGVVDALDATGNGQPTETVAGLTDSSRYKPNATFWRMKIDHFTPWDCNWPYGPPDDATKPNPKEDPKKDERQEADERERCDTTETNSFVEDRSGVFHEDIPIPGTDMTLHYASNRVRGYKTRIAVPASGATVPASLKRIVVRVRLAGRALEQELPAQPYQVAEFAWDGLDHLGREAGGRITAVVSIGFVYNAVYYSPGEFPQAFGQTGAAVTAVSARQEVIVWNHHEMVVLKDPRANQSLASGWTLSARHELSESLLKGDGTIVKHHVSMVDTVAGNGISGYSGDGGPATEAELYLPEGVAVGPDGSIFIAEPYNGTVRRVESSGIMTTVAGTDWWELREPSCFIRDGGPATEAELVPYDVAVDAAGNLYIADDNSSSVRKVNRSGIITTIAGNGTWGYSGDNGPATQAQLYMPKGVAVDTAGNVYIADYWSQCIRKVDTNGIITTVAGIGANGGSGGFGGDGGRATEALLSMPSDVAVDLTGNLYIADTGNARIRRVDTSGIITTVAGRGTGGNSGDGGPAVEAELSWPVQVAIDTKGSLFIADNDTNSIRKVDGNGIITTVAGGRVPEAACWPDCYSGDGGAAIYAEFWNPAGVAVDPAGYLYVADATNMRIRKVAPPSAFPGAIALGIDETLFAEKSGVGHIISSKGQHLRTVDLATGLALRTFGYDAAGRLVTIADQFGKVTRMTRDANGFPSTVISPDGLTTQLTVNASGNLTRVAYPDGTGYVFEYTPDGLMTAETDPNGNRFEHLFDAAGGLTDSFDPEGGHWSFTRSVLPDGKLQTQKATGEGNATTYRDQAFSGVSGTTATAPNGGQNFFGGSADGLSGSRDTSCGMHVDYTYDLDPEYKHRFLKSTKTTLPSGLVSTTTTGRFYQDTDGNGTRDEVTETVAINGKTWTTVNGTRSGTITKTSPVGRAVTTRYDPTTLLTEEVSVPGLFPTTFGYDASGRLTSTAMGARATAIAYDANGYPGSVITPDGKTIRYTYDVMGRLREELRSEGTHIRYDYDANGNVTVLTTPTNIDHGLDYTANDQRSLYQTPLSGSYVYEYDKERNLKTIAMPSGRVITNTRTNGLLTSTQVPEGVVAYGRDCGGRIASATKGSEMVSYLRNGALLARDTRTGLLSQILTYGYDNDFNLTSFAYAGGTENFGYDPDGLLTAASGFRIARNAQNGLPQSVTDGSLTLNRTFNGYGEIDANAYAVNGANVYTWAVTQRDGAGRIEQKQETLAGQTVTWDYAYDDLGRLIEVKKGGAVVEAYTYDANGNRTSEINTLRSVATQDYAYSAEDHLVTAGADRYSFDADGFLATKQTQGGITTYDYSSRGELLQVTRPDNTILTYDHDPLGRRVAKRVNGAIVEKYLWEGINTKLLAVYDGAGNLLTRFRYGDGRVPLSMTYEGETYYLVSDQVGTVRAAADSAGAIVKRIDYDSFGNVLADSNLTFPMPLGFAGGLQDRSAGLVRFGARDYDPSVGRWVAKDPIDFAGRDLNLFAYVAHEPIANTDPFGLVCGSGLTDPFVPDILHRGTSWIYDFTEACSKHDSCYNTPGASKSQCDSTFLENMSQECSRLSGFKWLDCFLNAHTYYYGVKWVGGPAYRNSQGQCR